MKYLVMCEGTNELEILLIISEEKQKDYDKVKSSTKPKIYAKQNILFNKKRYDNSSKFYRDYYGTSPQLLAEALRKNLYSGGSVSKTSYPCSMYAVIISSKKVVQTSRIGKFSASSCAFDKYKRKQPMPNNIDNEILFDKLDKGQYTLYYYIYHFKTEKYSDGAEN